MPLLFDIRRFCVHDGPGIRTTVFFKGCPLRCAWCHNPESWKPESEYVKRKTIIGESVFEREEIIGRNYSSADVVKEVLRDRPFFEESGGGVTFSGGEPLSQPSALSELLKDFRIRGVHTAVDTSGWATEEVFRQLSPLTDLFLFDIKHADNLKHIEYTGVSNERILQNLKLAAGMQVPLIVRLPLIAGVNEDQENLNATLNILQQVKSAVQRVDILPFHKLGQNKYSGLNIQSREFSEPAEEILRHWQDTLKSNDFLTIIGG